MDNRTIRILLIEENQHWAEKLTSMIRESKLDTEIIYVRDLNNAIIQLKQNEIDVVLTELNLPGSVGVETFRILSSFNLPIVILSEKDDDDLACTLIRHGAQDCLIKNGVINPRGVKRTLQHAVQRDMFVKYNLGDLSTSLKELRKTRKVIDSCATDIEAINDAARQKVRTGITTGISNRTS